MHIRTDEPIAIVGMGCRFPGGADDQDSYWRLIHQKVDAVVRVPADRWSVERFCDTQSDRPGKAISFDAGMLHQDMNGFDHKFFGIMPRDAHSMDPQQRLLLEVAFEAIDDTGLPLEALQARPTSVFVGGFTLDNMLTKLSETEIHFTDMSTAASITMTMLAARISHAFDLRGPSLSLDTACSSSLVAVHLACMGLLDRSSDFALAGGVTVISRPEYTVAMSKGQFLSPRGRCMAFDERAAGYVRGEGAGIVCLRRLEDALADNQRIHAVIRSSSVNHDGRTVGVSLPNPVAQKALLRDVLLKANVDARTVGYVEAHGTGTQAGDKAEISALSEVLDATARDDQRCFVGSVKTNIGHLESAAGVAGLIKATMVVSRGEIPPNLHFERPNPALQLEATCLRVPTEVAPWPEEGAPRRAIVNSFGYGGTNAAVLVEQAPLLNDVRASLVDDRLSQWIVPVSGHTEGAVRAMADRIATHLESAGTQQDVVWSSWKRIHHRTRAAVVATDTSELIAGLRALAASKSAPGVLGPVSRPATVNGSVFVYTGMGPQWEGMGRTLIEAEPVFSDTVRAFDEAFRRHSGWSLVDEVFLAPEGTARSMARTDVAQPANVALQLGLTALLIAWGVTPRAVVGHSVGEISAAYAAGLLTLEEVAQVAYVRSKLQQILVGAGTMLAVGLSEADVESRIAACSDVCIAAVNAPSSVTLAGSADELQHMESMLKDEGVFARLLRVDVPYHSKHMDRIKGDLLQQLENLEARTPVLPIYSTAVGARWTSTEGWAAAYWWRNVRQPVKFAAAIDAMVHDGHRTFIEVGPHPVLATSIREIVEADATISTLRRGMPELNALMELRANLFMHRVEQDIDGMFGPNVRRSTIPSYAWQREAYPYLSARSKRRLQREEGRSPWLNRALEGPARGWEVELGTQYFPWLSEHRIQDHAVVPAAAYLASFFDCVSQTSRSTALALADVSFSAMLRYQPSESVFLATTVDDTMLTIASTNQEKAKWQAHARARVVTAADALLLTEGEESLGEDFIGEGVDVDDLYAEFANRGLEYGPMFRTVRSLHKGQDWVTASISAESPLNDTLIDPTVLDGTFQALLALSADGTYVPVSIGRITIWGPLRGELLLSARRCGAGSSSQVFNLRLTTPGGEPLAMVEGLVVQRLPDVTKKLPPSYTARWELMPSLAALIPSAKPEGVTVIHDGSMLARSVIADLGATHVSCEHCSLGARTSIADNRRVAIVLDPADPESLAGVIKTTQDMLVTLQTMGSWRLQGHLFLLTVDSQKVLRTDKACGLAGAAAWGLAGVFRNEHGWKVSFIDLPHTPTALDMRLVTTTLLYDDEQHDFAIRNGEKYVHHVNEHELVPLSATRMVSVDRDPVVLNTAGRGLVQWSPATRHAPSAGEVELEVDHVGVSFKDYLKVRGLISDQALRGTYTGHALGHDCTGRVVRVGEGVTSLHVGDEVLAFAPGSFRSFVTVKATKVVALPAQLSVENGAVLLGVITAILGLDELGRLKAGERVLIHQASGTVGTFAVQLAQHIGAEIFTTAGTEERREALQKLGVRVYDSTDARFAAAIRRDTHGEGIDVVFGAFDGPAAEEALRLLRPLGRFVDIAKRAVVNDTPLSRRPFHLGISYHTLDVDILLADHEEPLVRAMATMCRLFAEGALRPMDTEIYSAQDVGSMFESMAERAYAKRLIVRMRGSSVECTTPSSAVRKAATYLVTGGTAGFGLALAEALARSGAEHLLLVSRSGETAELKRRQSLFKQLGTTISTAAVDVTDQKALRKVIAEIPRDRPLRGVVHAAAKFDDALLINTTHTSVEDVFKTKVGGALNLHMATKDIPLDFFVLCSSVSAIVGNVGQAAYAAANSALDGLAQWRHGQRMAAMSIQWGAIDDVGVVARTAGLSEILREKGMAPLRVVEAQHAFRIALGKTEEAVLTIGASDWGKMAQVFPSLGQSSKFERVLGTAACDTETTVSKAWTERLRTVSAQERLSAVTSMVRATIGRVLRTSEDDVEIETALPNLGMDSLAATELAMEISKEFGTMVKPVDLLGGVSCSEIARSLYADVERDLVQK
ncbi:MAG: SDR family NAD(P)-dependent oxidoreductase [Nitrospira sp.]|nr:SDR family NAD(P)-dependent oxidoreductase [Nitrospira sp.]